MVAAARPMTSPVCPFRPHEELHARIMNRSNGDDTGTHGLHGR